MYVKEPIYDYRNYLGQLQPPQAFPLREPPTSLGEIELRGVSNPSSFPEATTIAAYKVGENLSTKGSH